MSIRLGMLQVARVSQRVLGDASNLVAGFIAGQWNPDGGVRDRSGVSDLYYTVFGLESLQALQRPPPASVRGYLQRFGAGEDLDFVHRCCLARSWAVIGLDEFAGAQSLAATINGHRSADGGFAVRPGQAQGTAYAAYLATAALQDLRAPLPPGSEIAAALATLRADDGGFGNQRGTDKGTTPATVSVVVTLHACDRRADKACGDWLLARRHLSGGFVAHPEVPLPDLLSTATALHALACLELPLPKAQVEEGLDYVDSLWTNAGAFHGHWAEEELDVEYAYYGLLALGHLGI